MIVRRWLERHPRLARREFAKPCFACWCWGREGRRDCNAFRALAPRTNEYRGRSDEHPAVLDAGLLRTHADDRHADAERGVDVPRRERRSPPSGCRGGFGTRSKPGAETVELLLPEQARRVGALVRPPLKTARRSSISSAAAPGRASLSRARIHLAPSLHRAPDRGATSSCAAMAISRSGRAAFATLGQRGSHIAVCATSATILPLPPGRVPCRWLHPAARRARGSRRL